MAKIPENVRQAVEAAGPYPIATASPEGKPNLVYVSFLRILDDETIQVADNFFFKTRQNLDANPALTVTALHPDGGGCFQIKGPVEILTEGAVYDDCVSWVHGRSAKLPAKAAVNLHVDEIYSGAERIV